MIYIIIMGLLIGVGIGVSLNYTNPYAVVLFICVFVLNLIGYFVGYREGQAVEKRKNYEDTDEVVIGDDGELISKPRSIAKSDSKSERS